MAQIAPDLPAATFALRKTKETKLQRNRGVCGAFSGMVLPTESQLSAIRRGKAAITSVRSVWRSRLN
jgi:hypothetical protein